MAAMSSWAIPFSPVKVVGECGRLMMPGVVVSAASGGDVRFRSLDSAGCSVSESRAAALIPEFAPSSETFGFGVTSGLRNRSNSRFCCCGGFEIGRLGLGAEPLVSGFCDEMPFWFAAAPVVKSSRSCLFFPECVTGSEDIGDGVDEAGRLAFDGRFEAGSGSAAVPNSENSVG
ncbi:hypothetical protein [Planctomicrobium sp. SH664]|uniref:hypothetical protein n=1 Tax=Planctomicrobium sp. SH664 TaxID=3448125 RepID=UPI003F5BDC68